MPGHFRRRECGRTPSLHSLWLPKLWRSVIGRDHSGSTVVTKKCLVTRLTAVERGTALGAPALGKTANAAQVSCIPLESVDALASRLETIAKGVRSAGFSKDVAGRVARSKL